MNFGQSGGLCHFTLQSESRKPSDFPNGNQIKKTKQIKIIEKREGYLERRLVISKMLIIFIGYFQFVRKGKQVYIFTMKIKNQKNKILIS